MGAVQGGARNQSGRGQLKGLPHQVQFNSGEEATRHVHSPHSRINGHVST